MRMSRDGSAIVKSNATVATCLVALDQNNVCKLSSRWEHWIREFEESRESQHGNGMARIVHDSFYSNHRRVLWPPKTNHIMCDVALSALCESARF